MPTELDELIGKRLKAARRLLGFKSARAFSRHHHIPNSTYFQHETGKRSLNPSMLLTYATHLNVTPDWIISGDQNNNTETAINLPLLRLILKKEVYALLQPNPQYHFDKVIEFCMASYTHAVRKTMDNESKKTGLPFIT